MTMRRTNAILLSRGKQDTRQTGHITTHHRHLWRSTYMRLSLLKQTPAKVMFGEVRPRLRRQYEHIFHVLVPNNLLSLDNEQRASTLSTT